LAALTLALAGTLAACAAHDDTLTDKVSLKHEPQVDVLGLDTDDRPAAFTDRKGNRWVKMKDITEFASERKAEEYEPKSKGGDPSKMSDEELAEYWRPVMFANNAQYTLDLPAREFVAKLKRGEFYGGRAPSPAMAADGLQTLKVIGTDDRQVVSGMPPAGMDRSQMLMSEAAVTATNNTSACTGTLMGPKTAISAAHCFYDPQTFQWRTQRHWSFGVATRKYTGQAIQQTTAYPPYLGCYFVWIPAAFVSTNTGVVNDFSVIEFTCGVSPGSQGVPYQGSWTADDAQVTGSGASLIGYPATLPSSLASGPVRVPN
jgi:Trypsin